MSKLKRIGLIVFISVVLLTAVGIYFYIDISDKLEALGRTPIEEVELTNIDDGLYVGEFDQFPIYVLLEVEIIDHEIISIIIIKHDNGQGTQAEVIIDDVIEIQKIDVDAIAGATYSSKAILLALQDALS